MEQEFHHGNIVNLLINQEVVIQGTQPSDTCHEEMHGLGFLLVVAKICHLQQTMHAKLVKLLVDL